MAEETSQPTKTQREPLPDRLKWASGWFGVGVSIMWVAIGTNETLRWLELTFGAGLIALVFLWIGAATERLEIISGLAKLTSLVFGIAFGALLVVGAFTVGRAILGPFAGPSYTDSDGPQNWRR